MKRFLRVVDHFYRDPEAVRERALCASYDEPEHLVGYRSRAYQPRGIKEHIERCFGVRIPKWEDDLDAVETCNGVFFTSYSQGSRAEVPGVHYDEPVTWAMFLIYLTPDAPYDAGTSLWQHRKTGLLARPTERDASRLRTSLDRLETIVHRDRHIHERWIEIDRVGNVFNRAVMFPGGLFHSATRHFGSGFRDGRIYQSFHFPVRFTLSRS